MLVGAHSKWKKKMVLHLNVKFHHFPWRAKLMSSRRDFCPLLYISLLFFLSPVS